MGTSEFTSRYSRWVTTIFFALAFYGIGASMMDSFVVYHTWRFIGEPEFANAHIQSGSRVVQFAVLPLLCMTIFLVLLFWHRPVAIPRKLLWAAVIFSAIPWLSSAFIQIPMQLELDKGKNDELLRQLIITDWIRVIPTWIFAVIVMVMFKKSLGKA
ncbi:MAG: hypothetical protein L0Y35_08725 [Flammeovirgaceae bacterium]|nr:hypothetical protein [Flammeovirgaceae bacterium]